jgi:hypothetical protein
MSNADLSLLSDCIDDSIKALPSKVLSRIIAEYSLNKPFQFDTTRAFTHPALGYNQSVKLLKKKDMTSLSITNDRVKCHVYSESWIHIMSKFPIHILQDEWSFFIEGINAHCTFLGLAQVTGSGENEIVELFNVVRLQQNKCNQSLECCVSKSRHSLLPNTTCVNISIGNDFCECGLKIWNNTDNFSDYSKQVTLMFPENLQDLYFFVTTGYDNQVITVHSPNIFSAFDIYLLQKVTKRQKKKQPKT